MTKGVQKMLTWKNRQFYLNDEPFEIHSGAIHYFRSLPDKWPELLQKLKNCGMNTVETYCAWNLHEEYPTQFDFEGRLDVGHFIDLAAEIGLYVIMRPGPFICAEWEAGGLPAWLLRDENFRARTDEGEYLNYVKRYFDELMPHLISRMETRGGNIIMFAAENEYGSFGNNTNYMNKCVNLLKSYGVDVPIITADGHTMPFLQGGHADDCLCGLDFGYDGNIIEEHYESQAILQPNAPFFHIEHWVGMFSHWGEPSQHYGTQHVENEVKHHLEHGNSFNLYMFHGGTNFGFTSGANGGGMDIEDNHKKCRYLPDVTSYDYDALLTEWGEVTPKYLAVQNVMSKHLGVKLPENKPVPLMSLGEIPLTQTADLFNQIEAIGGQHTSSCIHGMEYYGQNQGYILYRTYAYPRKGAQVLHISGIADHVHIYFNGIHRGTIYRNDEKQSLELGDWFEEGGTLDLLVGALGRLNFGPDMLRGDRKGILDQVYISHYRGPRQALCNWEVYTLPMDNLDKLTFQDSDCITTMPSFFKGTFKTDKQHDCFVHPEGFTKGFIVVNGFNLGRYWNIGPQLSLYLPGSILKAENEIIIFDEEPVSNPKLVIKDEHIISSMSTDVGPVTIV